MTEASRAKSRELEHLANFHSVAAVCRQVGEASASRTEAGAEAAVESAATGIECIKLSEGEQEVVGEDEGTRASDVALRLPAVIRARMRACQGSFGVRTLLT